VLLYGAEGIELASPTIGEDGSLEGYLPLPELPAYGTLIIGFAIK
jgi:hypothetical protein